MAGDEVGRWDVTRDAIAGHQVAEWWLANYPDDPFDQAVSLCDPDGTVRRGAMHHGTDYDCTGHAHFGGYHILCTSPAHYVREVPDTEED